MIVLYIYLKKILWFGTTIVLILSSIYFNIKLKCAQLNIKKMVKSLKNSNQNSKIFDTLFLSLGGRIGVGSLAGTAFAIYIGGSGTIFWLLITSILTSILAFIETIMGHKYKLRTINGTYSGGPSYYLKYGLGFKKLALIYSLILLISYIFGFLGIQANTITITLENYLQIPKQFISLIIAMVTLFVIFGGIKEIIKVSNKLVPFMAILYTAVAVFIIIFNIDKLPNIIISIVKNAFNIKPFFSSFIPMVVIGLQRGIFSSEAGLGTGAIASSVSSDNDYVRQGYIQVLGVYISTFICIITAFVILLANPDISNSNGIVITIFSYHKLLGFYGDILIVLSILLFSFSTIITGYYYGESGLAFFINSKKKIAILFLKFVTIICIYVGGILSAFRIWNLVDILVAVLASINVTALILLRKDIFFYDK